MNVAERLEDVAATLEELWISYNQISSLDGIAVCQRLGVLFMSNNQVRWVLAKLQVKRYHEHL